MDDLDAYDAEDQGEEPVAYVGGDGENERENGDGLEEGEGSAGEESEGEGDHEEGGEAPAKKGNVDDDEDRKKPQYIPKSGPFYQHDTRIDSDEEVDTKKEDDVGQLHR